MKVHKFERVESSIIDVPKIRKINKNKNGLYNVLYNGYASHVPIVIRPDDIINNIIAVWSKYIVINAEKFREFFVGHEGKKKLTYCSSGHYSDNRMSEFMRGLINLIVEDQKDGKILWASSLFSTTIDSDHMVRAVATLASQKEYYNYGVVLLCGFSEVMLEGTENDWSDLISVIEKMPVPDDHLNSWRINLMSLIDNMTKDDEDFWQSCVVNHPYGSGGQSRKDGWITIFNPINEKGEWLSQIKDNDILDLTSTFNVEVNDNGVEFNVDVSSGPSLININNGHLSVVNQTAFIRNQKI